MRADAMAVKVASLGAAAHAALKAQVARINALNVYPVPDGDTGTNMLLTLESTLEGRRRSRYAGPEEASRAVARAALMGAQGELGRDPLADDPGRLRRSREARLARRRQSSPPRWTGAKERAYASVREPVEGTMLTVIKDAARAAVEARRGRRE